MELQALFSQLQVAPEYTIHVVPQDEVVVLYNSRRPLLLQGMKNVMLFQLLQKQTSPHDVQASTTRSPNDIPTPEDIALSDLALHAIQLIEKNVLCFTEEERSCPSANA